MKGSPTSLHIKYNFMERPQFVAGEVYHIYTRGVEKRKIFMDDKDRLRFVHDLYEFNDLSPANNIWRYFQKLNSKDARHRGGKTRKVLVEILCFCLMPNHYHLLVRQKVKEGITEFMRKLNTGYTNYFNKKYQRVGPLFQGKFKASRVIKEAHALYLPHYIHLNPLDTVMPGWRDKRIKNHKKALAFLDSYRWSSYLDYTGKPNFSSVIFRKFIEEMYGSGTRYRADMKEWLREMDFAELSPILFDDEK